jgi:hypothetical protein
MRASALSARSRAGCKSLRLLSRNSSSAAFSSLARSSSASRLAAASRISSEASDAFHKQAAVVDHHIGAVLSGRERRHAGGFHRSRAASSIAEQAGMPLEAYAQVRDRSARIAELPAWRDSAPALPRPRRVNTVKKKLARPSGALGAMRGY